MHGIGKHGASIRFSYLAVPTSLVRLMCGPQRAVWLGKKDSLLPIFSYQSRELGTEGAKLTLMFTSALLS